MDKVSVIIPAYNREQLIAKTLDSVALQNWLPLEIIVVDNNSSDNTLNIVENWRQNRATTFPDDSLVIKTGHEEKRGASAARNRGFTMSEGEFIIFFDSDDEMRPGLIEEAIKGFRENPDADIICWRCAIHQLDGTIRTPPFDPGNPVESHLIHTLLRPQGYMMRREIFEKSGGWNEDLPAWNDWELGLRHILKGNVIKGIPGIQADIYAQENSITGKSFSTKEGTWEKAIDAAESAVNESHHKYKKRILRILDYRRIVLAAHYNKEGNKSGATELRRRVLQSQNLFHKIMFNTVYHYTTKGGRGAWRIVRFFI